MTGSDRYIQQRPVSGMTRRGRGLSRIMAATSQLELTGTAALYVNASNYITDPPWRQIPVHRRCQVQQNMAGTTPVNGRYRVCCCQEATLSSLRIYSTDHYGPQPARVPDWSDSPGPDRLGPGTRRSNSDWRRTARNASTPACLQTENRR